MNTLYIYREDQEELIPTVNGCISKNGKIRPFDFVFTLKNFTSVYIIFIIRKNHKDILKILDLLYFI